MLSGLLFAERYKLEKFIGQGGMSLVYRAVDNRTGHSVAVKILKSEFNADKEFLERFQREAQAASLMNHHNIVNLLDVGVENEHRYLVLEYVNGLTLKDIIRQRGKLDSDTAIQIAIRILSALQHAHSKGIVHRDIKPQNVLVHADGHVKVSDFGIARMTNTMTISQDNTVLGSVHYSSPEQATGNVVQATSDLYSTGVVLYEMLTGRVPFTGDTPVSVALQQVNAVAPPIESISPEVSYSLIQVVMKAMEKNPKHRFQSAREMAEALTEAQQGRYVAPVIVEKQAPRPRPKTIAKMSMWKNKRVLITATGVCLVLLTLFWGMMSVYERVVNSVFAPDVTGMQTEEAMALAKRSELSWQYTSVSHDSIAAGVVISQVPTPDTQMEKGDSLFATISLGPEVLTVPDVMNQLYEDAMQKLTEKNISFVVVKVASTQLKGTVIEQSPAAGQTLGNGQTVELTVSGGSATVPQLVDLFYEEAEMLIQNQKLASSEPIYIDTTDAGMVGKVMAQSPEAGTMVVENATITLTIAQMSEKYQADMMVSLPNSESARQLTVTMMIDDQEVKKYESTVPQGISGDSIVPISSQSAGTYLCKVYLDGMVVLEQWMTFE